MPVLSLACHLPHNTPHIPSSYNNEQTTKQTKAINNSYIYKYLMLMWHKPCRTFHPWCLCIKTRCLFIEGVVIMSNRLIVFSVKADFGFMGIFRKLWIDAWFTGARQGRNYREISNIRRTKSPNLFVPRLVLQLSLLNPMKPGVRSRMKM